MKNLHVVCLHIRRKSNRINMLCAWRNYLKNEKGAALCSVGLFGKFLEKFSSAQAELNEFVTGICRNCSRICRYVC